MREKGKRFYVEKIMMQEQRLRVSTSDGVELEVLKYIPQQVKGKVFMLH